MSTVNNELAVFVGIDTNAPLREKPRKAPKPVVTVVPLDPLSLIHAPAPAPRVSKWAKFSKVMGVFRTCDTALRIVSYVPLAATVLPAAGVGLAYLGGYSLHKAPETEAGRAVARVAESAESKPTLAARIIEPVKAASAQPIAAVQAGAKKAVVAVETKVDQVEATIEEKAQDLTQALQGLKADDTLPSESAGAFGQPDEQPEAQPKPVGFLGAARARVAGARDAVAAQVQGAFGGPELTPEQIKRRREIIARERYVADRRAKKIRNATYLGQMGAQQMAGAAALSEQSNAQFWDNTNAGLQRHGNMIGQVNQTLQRGNR